MEARFNVRGKVQGVFFRKSFVHWLEINGLKGGATNNSQDHQLVHCTVIGEEGSISALKEILQGSSFNNMGAKVEEIEEQDHQIQLSEHQAKTSSPPAKLPFGVKLKVESPQR